jgi:hypothetical protein
MENLTKHVLYVGLNDKDTKKQLVTTPKAKDIVNSVCGDCSIQEITGYYTHDNGEKVKENTLKVELLFKEDKQVLTYCQDLKRLLNQESIALNIETVNSRLV